MTNMIIVTTTFYNDDKEGKIRKRLAKKFFVNCVNLGYETCLIDGGTDNGRFIDERSQVNEVFRLIEIRK